MCIFPHIIYYVLKKNNPTIHSFKGKNIQSLPTDVFSPTTWHSVVVKVSILQTCFISLSFSPGDISHPAAHTGSLFRVTTVLWNRASLSAPDAWLSGLLLAQRGGGGGLRQVADSFLWDLCIFCWAWTDAWTLFLSDRLMGEPPPVIQCSSGVPAKEHLP